MKDWFGHKFGVDFVKERKLRYCPRYHPSHPGILKTSYTPVCLYLYIKGCEII
jgi:hypothetical protein